MGQDINSSYVPTAVHICGVLKESNWSTGNPSNMFIGACHLDHFKVLSATHLRVS